MNWLEWIEHKATEAQAEIDAREKAYEKMVCYSDKGKVNMSKILAKAAHGLSLNQKRLIMYAVSKLDSEAKQPKQIVISAHDYAKEMEIKTANVYRDLQSAVDNLFGRYISISYESDKGQEIEKIHWVSSAKYLPGQGTVELRFTPELSPYISRLNQGNYISYKLKKVIDLRSIYSWRLLELLMQWPDTQQLFISLDDFKHAMETPQKYLYADVRIHCIEKSIRELKEKVNLEITWKPIKEGRSVRSLQFFWKEAEELEMDLQQGRKTKKRKKA